MTTGKKSSSKFYCGFVWKCKTALMFQGYFKKHQLKKYTLNVLNSIYDVNIKLLCDKLIWRDFEIEL